MEPNSFSEKQKLVVTGTTDAEQRRLSDIKLFRYRLHPKIFTSS